MLIEPTGGGKKEARIFSPSASEWLGQPTDSANLAPVKNINLGPWLAVDREKNGDDALTVPALQGMLEMLETYFPEEIIGAPQFQAQEAAISAHAKA